MTPNGQALILGWARRGLTDEQIASNMNISLSSLKNWKRKHPSFFNALRLGKDETDFLVENALFKEAVSGNVTAQIFWLKNRRPIEYRDKHDIEQSGNINIIYDSLVIRDLPEEDDDEPDSKEELGKTGDE